MKLAEQVTFGGSGLDRAAYVRGDGAALKAARAHADAACLLIWRGKVLMQGAMRDELALVQLAHPILQKNYNSPTGDPIFLGLEDSGAPTFAHDISGWSPDDLDTEAMSAFLDASEQTHPDLPADCAFVELRTVMTRISPRTAELCATAKALFSWHHSHRFCARCGSPSTAVMAGWQRDCPDCGGQHFPRTDPVVIMLITHGNSVLMGRSPGWPEGMFSLLAGFVEPGETLEAAVRREVFEEAGVRVGAVSYLSSQPWPFPSSLMIGCAGIAETTDLNIDPVEIEEALWITRDEMADIFAGQHPKIKAARKGAIAHFLLQNWLADTLD